MAAPKRTPIQRERDLELITTLYCKGKFQHEIAKSVGVSQSQIAYDLKTIQKRWREGSRAMITELKERELVRIDNLEREAWASFEKSKRRHVKKIEKVVTGGKSGDTVEEGKTSENQYGDPRFLMVIKECIAKRCQILGLDEPTKFEGKITEPQSYTVGGKIIVF